ncbi:MAG: coenzyme F420-0:L-glutamate ligase [Kosmotogaceae bacterium]
MVEIFPVKFRNPVTEKAEDKKEITLRILQEIENNEIELQERDILVVTSKIISILEGRMFKKSDISVKKRVKLLAKLFGLSPAVLQKIFDESRILGVLPQKHIAKIKGVLEHQLQFSTKPEETRRAARGRLAYVVMTRKNKLVMDSAGIDTSNLPEDHLVLLPKDPAESAKRIRKTIKEHLGKNVAVIITDTLYSPRRNGAMDICLGSSGIFPITKNDAKLDLFGTVKMGGTDVIVDSVAAMAGTIMGATHECTPAAVFRGLEYEPWDDEKPLGDLLFYPKKAKSYGGILLFIWTVIFKGIQYILFLKSK